MKRKLFWFFMSWLGLFLLSLAVGWDTYNKMPMLNKFLLAAVGVFNQIVAYIDGRTSANR